LLISHSILSDQSKARNIILIKEEMHIKTKFYGSQSDIDRRRRRRRRNL
jgi:hypothetical protein